MKNTTLMLLPFVLALGSVSALESAHEPLPAAKREEFRLSSEVRIDPNYASFGNAFNATSDVHNIP